MEFSTGFERHKIEEVRTTSLNLYRSSPWAWALVNLGVYTIAPNAAMIRGTATEAGFNCWVKNQFTGNFDTVRDQALAVAIETHDHLLSPDELDNYQQIESRGLVIRMTEALIEQAKDSPLWRKEGWEIQPTVRRDVELDRPGQTVVLVGHVDYWHPETRTVVDLKTTAAKPPSLRLSHKVQGAVYADLLGAKPEDTHFHFVVGRKASEEVLTHTMTIDGDAEGLMTAYDSLNSLEKFLFELDAEKILEMCMFDMDNWAFRNLKEKVA